MSIMGEFKNSSTKSDDKEVTIEKCLQAINETQNKMNEEEAMKKLIRETLEQIREKEQKSIKNKVLNIFNKFKREIDTCFIYLQKLLNKNKYKNIIMKNIIMNLMMFLVLSLFIFNGVLNRAYANNYNIKEIDKNILENLSLKQEGNMYQKSNNSNQISEGEESNHPTNENIVGVNSEGQKSSYDAFKINEKLKNGDYSNNGEKIVFLTFDDGTSTTVTPQVLHILDEYNVKATFFLVGKNIEDGGNEAKELVKKEFNSGHAIGNHSYSHNYNILYPDRHLNLDSFKSDYDKNSKLLKSILGDNFSTRVLRCPGGYMSWKGMSELDGYLKDNNMTYIDWNSLSGDAEGKKKNSDELVKHAIETSKDKEIVVLLMHDTYGKEETVKSLPNIIEYFKNNGFEFKTLV